MEQQQQVSMSSTHLMSNWMSKLRRQAMQREQPEFDECDLKLNFLSNQE